MKVYPEDIENILLTMPSVKDAVVVGLTGEDQETVVHAVLLMEDPADVGTAIKQTNRQLASHQQIRSYTIWPEQDFPRTYTLKAKRPEVLKKLQAVRPQAKGKGEKKPTTRLGDPQQAPLGAVPRGLWFHPHPAVRPAPP